MHWERNDKIHEKENIKTTTILVWKDTHAIMKLDYEKTYGSIRWDFLYHMIQQFRLCGKWIKWINGCLTSSIISILVNGSPTQNTSQ